MYRELYRHGCGHGSHAVVVQAVRRRAFDYHHEYTHTHALVARRRFPWRQQAVAARRRFPLMQQAVVHHSPILVYTRASRVARGTSYYDRPARGRHEYVHETPWLYCTVALRRAFDRPAWGRHEYVHDNPWLYCTVAVRLVFDRPVRGRWLDVRWLHAAVVRRSYCCCFP